MFSLVLSLILPPLSAATSYYVPPAAAESSVAATAAGTVKLRAEYRCDLEWQLAPGVKDPLTGKDFKITPFTFVEFSEPLKMDGYEVYGTGNEFAADDRNWEGIKFVLLKREQGGGPKFTFGMLLSGTTLASTKNLAESLRGTHEKVRLGVLSLEAGSQPAAVFQRAPIEYELGLGTLRPLAGRCSVREVSGSADPREPTLGYFQKPWK